MSNPRRNFIAHWRKFKGFKVEPFLERLAEYADQHGIDVPRTAASLSRIENGKQNFKIDFVGAVAAILANGEDDPSISDLLSVNPFSGAIETTRAIEQMTPRQRKIAHGVLLAMLAEDRKAYRAEQDDGELHGE